MLPILNLLRLSSLFCMSFSLFFSSLLDMLVINNSLQLSTHIILPHLSIISLSNLQECFKRQTSHLHIFHFFLAEVFSTILRRYAVFFPSLTAVSFWRSCVVFSFSLCFQLCFSYRFNYFMSPAASWAIDLRASISLSLTVG